MAQFAGAERIVQAMPLRVVKTAAATLRAWSADGTTKGGYAGHSFRLTAISATQWVIQNGLGLATGTEATAFATS